MSKMRGSQHNFFKSRIVNFILFFDKAAFPIHTSLNSLQEKHLFWSLLQNAALAEKTIHLLDRYGLVYFIEKIGSTCIQLIDEIFIDIGILFGDAKFGVLTVTQIGHDLTG